MTVTTRSEARQGDQIARPEWARYFDELTASLEHGNDLEVSIEIVGEPDLGPRARRPTHRVAIESEDGTLTLLRVHAASGD